MPPADTYDYTQDPQFLQAPPEQQHAYLSANDPDYAQAHPDQQRAYLSHVNGGQYTEKGAASNPPIAGVTGNTPAGSQGPKSPLSNAIIRREAEEPSDQAIGRATGAIGVGAPAMVSPVTTAGAVIGGAAGAPIGESGARRVVKAFGGGQGAQDTAGTIGGWGGGIAGSIAGGGAGANLEEVPGEFTIGGFKFRNPFHNPDEPSLGGGAPEPSLGEFETQRDAQLVGEGRLAKIPIRMPKTKIPEEFPAPPVPVRAHGEMEADLAKRASQTPEAVAKKGLAVGQAKSTLVHGRPFEQLNEEEQAQALMRRGADQERIDAGATPEGSNQRVTKVPEPNPVPPGENPNNQQSVPRRTTLVQNAKRGKEGAGTQLNQIHGPVLYEPKGAGYSGVREQIPLNEQGQAVPPIKGGSNGTIGQGPIGKPAAAPQGLTNIPSDVELLKALTQKNPGMDNATANRIVQETLDELDPTNKYVLPEVREQAQQRIQRIMGPEQRGPMRLGPEARGIK